MRERERKDRTSTAKTESYHNKSRRGWMQTRRSPGTCSVRSNLTTPTKQRHGRMQRRGCQCGGRGRGCACVGVGVGVKVMVGAGMGEGLTRCVSTVEEYEPHRHDHVKAHGSPGGNGAPWPAFGRPRRRTAPGHTRVLLDLPMAVYHPKAGHEDRGPVRRAKQHCRRGRPVTARSQHGHSTATARAQHGYSMGRVTAWSQQGHSMVTAWSKHGHL